jgi:hypothetical protein
MLKYKKAPLQRRGAFSIRIVKKDFRFIASAGQASAHEPHRALSASIT